MAIEINGSLFNSNDIAVNSDNNDNDGDYNINTNNNNNNNIRMLVYFAYLL